jgi:pyruvate dehydrogenase E2 component (dihydrolipoamide acetyltransferase)
MPEVAANTQTATLADWLVAENESYSSDDPLATIETDKAVVDLTAEADGVLLRILASAGTEVPVGEPIAVIGQQGESAADVDRAIASLLEGAGTGRAARSPDVTTDGALAVTSPARGERIFTSPLARRLAKEAGIATESISGTGPNGRIVRKDVERTIAAQGAGRDGAEEPSRAGALRPATAAPVADRPTESRPPVAAFTDLPHSRMRRAIARRLTQSMRTVPHFYVRGSARVDELLRMRTQLNEVAAVKISVNDLIVKAVARAHQLVPAMNSIWTDDAIRRYSSVDIGVAVSTDDGLAAPVLRAVEQMSIGAVAETTRELGERARSGRLRQHELEGGCSTVTNLGMYGTDEFAAIINPPQSSILAVGGARSVPIATPEGNVEVGSVLSLTLSVDHRAVDGAIAAQWMRVLVQTLEAPVRILL